MNLCNCKEPQPIDFDYLESWCKLCGHEYIAARPDISYIVPVKTPWYAINVHTWSSGNLALAIHHAILYYIFIYPLFTFFFAIFKINNWWDGLFSRKALGGWPPPKAKQPKNLWH